MKDKPADFDDEAFSGALMRPRPEAAAGSRRLRAVGMQVTLAGAPPLTGIPVTSGGPAGEATGVAVALGVHK